MRDNRSVEDALSIADDSGRVIVRVALALTAYIRDGHLECKRRAVADCLDTFLRTVGERITWVKHPTSFEWLAADTRLVSAISPWLLQVDPMTGWEICLHGGKDAEEASDIRISGLGLPSWSPQGLSHIKFVLPLTWFADHAGSMPEFSREMCRRLQPVHGYAGLCFVDSPSNALRQRSDPLIFGLANRFAGVEVDNPVSHAIYLGDHIKGVNWLTVLSDPLIARIGGREKLQSALPPAAKWIDYDGGGIVQASARPHFLDRKAATASDPDYSAVNRLLRPLRIGSLGLQASGRGPRFDAAASHAWLTRFD